MAAKPRRKAASAPVAESAPPRTEEALEAAETAATGDWGQPTMWDAPDMSGRPIEIVPVTATDGRKYDISVYTITMAELIEFDRWRSRRLQELGEQARAEDLGEQYLRYDLELAERTFAGAACEGRLYGDLEAMPSQVFKLALAVAQDFREAGGLRRAATAGGTNGARNNADMAALAMLANSSGDALPN